jgi:hypothetical protein
MLTCFEGRSFVARGKGIQALPMLAESCAGQMNAEWSGEVSGLSSDIAQINATTHSHIVLGEEWIQ